MRQPEPDQDRPYERLSFLPRVKGDTRLNDAKMAEIAEKEYVNNGLPVAPNVRLERFCATSAHEGREGAPDEKHYEKEDRCDIII